MERWAANTLRTLGIILTSSFVLITSLLLVLLSICASQGGISGAKHPEQVIPYLAGAAGVVVLGVWLIVWLARGIAKSPALELTAAPASDVPVTGQLSGSLDLPLRLSPLSRKAVDRLVLALGAQILVSAIAWIVNQLTFWTRPNHLAPHNWTLILLAPFILYHIPYAILIYTLVKQPSRWSFAYSLAVPAVTILQALFSLTVVGYYYVHRPIGFLLLVVPWTIHIAIIMLAYKAIQQVGIHPQPASLIVAAVVTFLYFSALHVLTPFLYRYT
jgi:hypothetical protein